MLGEASPVNIVLKLNQLVSLLSSIEEKVEFYLSYTVFMSSVASIYTSHVSLAHHKCNPLPQ